MLTKMVIGVSEYTFVWAIQRHFETILNDESTTIRDKMKSYLSEFRKKETANPEIKSSEVIKFIRRVWEQY